MTARKRILITDTLDEFFFKQKQRVARQLQFKPVKRERGDIMDCPGLAKDILDIDHKR